MFNPARLTIARQRRKLTKKALAEAIHVDQKTVIRWEDCEAQPTDENIAALSTVLGFPTNFFEGPDIDQPSPDAVSFRALTAMLARDRDAALAASSLAFLLSDWVDARFNLPKADLMDFGGGVDPEAAAEMLRQKWGLGLKPIRNMVHLLEAMGIRVFSLAEDTRALDAISMWRGEAAYIFLNTAKTAERSRFDAAHELGHLCLHKHGGPQGREAEDEANLFAASFLMPRAEIQARLPRVHTLQEIVEAKKYWRVSVGALNYRLHKLRITSEWQYRRFCIQSTERFSNSEPYPLQREVSTVWNQLLSALRSDGVNKHTLAEALALPVGEIENLLFRLTNMQSIDGRGALPTKSRARLRVVA
jgi:Zn-dependent peptidase ImmA (M78 family)/DNA-binding XRE family transcriptional regulator